MNIEFRDKHILDSVHSLTADWKVSASVAGVISDPSGLCSDSVTDSSYSGVVPGTVAMAVNGSPPHCWTPESDYDDKDWWYQTDFNVSKPAADEVISLRFHGLATLCEIWLNGEKLLLTDNMFRVYQIDISDKIQSSNNLVLVFRSIKHQLSLAKRARPKWKTKLTGDQQMRWIRTSVLGYVNAWTPLVKCIGPWRDAEVVYEKTLVKERLTVASRLEAGRAKLRVNGQFKCIGSKAELTAAKVEIAGQQLPLQIQRDQNLVNINGELDVSQVDFWWPHTHGKQARYNCRIKLTFDGLEKIYEVGQIGFKSVDFDTTKSQMSVNQQAVFCRGVCWTTSDFLSFNGSEEKLTRQLTLLKEAGVNLIRVGGTMVYESDSFYRLCDQLGILVWQDFMFASMDYPVEDSEFLQNTSAEVSDQLSRLSRHVCIASYCGNTDVKAQAAMFGLPKEAWSNLLFDEIMPELCEDIHPQIPYFSSSPDGGALPFHLGDGITHYWGVGAYMRPADDPNISRVKFASEGMGQSHLPVKATINEWIGKNRQPLFDAEWLSRIPKDLGAGWDFEQIRDFYIQQLFKLDPVYLRRTNPQRYLDIARVTTGEVLANVFRQWRRLNSQCNGGLIWFARDFWPCAGFGIIDSSDRPKAAYYLLKKVWAKQALLLNSEGLDGCAFTLINDSHEPLEAVLEVSLYSESGGLTKRVESSVSLQQHQTDEIKVDALLEAFYDSAYNYQFGEPAFDVLGGRLIDQAGELISEDYFFSRGYQRSYLQAPDLSARIREVNDNEIEVIICCDQFIQFAEVEIKDFEACENHFHVAPNIEKVVRFNRLNPSTRSIRGQMSALNLSAPLKIK